MASMREKKENAEGRSKKWKVIISSTRVAIVDASDFENKNKEKHCHQRQRLDSTTKDMIHIL